MKQLCTALLCFSLSTPFLGAQDKSAAASSNSFGWSLFQELEKSKESPQNILFSPLSAWMALTLASNGSTGETLDEFTKILAQEGWSRREANQSARTILDSLLTNPSSEEKLKIANAVWVNSDSFDLDDTFANDAETYYSILPDESIVRAQSFGDPQTLFHINDWVEKSTGGMIPTIIDKLSADMAAILLNALYFESKWETPFKARFTAVKPFYRADGKAIMATMMQSQSNDYKYAEDANFKILSLNFRSGTGEFGLPLPGRYALDIILPTAGSLSNFKLNEYQKLSQQLKYTYTQVSIPKFKFDYSKSLVETLKGMGLERAFSPTVANFTQIGQATQNQDLYISDVLQKTAVDMDENGFKAAAVTAVIISTTSAIDLGEAKTFIADQPFYFILRDTKDGLILFHGLMEDPTL